MRVGLVVNPVAGMGGRVGLKGTDRVVDEARRRGARPEAPARAERFLRAFAATPRGRDAVLLVAGGSMGEDVADAAEQSAMVLHVPGEPSSAEDTRDAVRAFVEAGADLVVFVGGDGTAADVAEGLRRSRSARAASGRAQGDGTAADVASSAAGVPMLGVPAGAKMVSAVFAETPEAAAAVAATFDATREAEVLDVDEEALRSGELRVAMKAVARVPAHAAMQHGKSAGADDDVEQESLGEAVAASLEPGVAHVLGAGTTMMAVKRALGVEGTLLGIDVVRDGALVVRDAAEKDLLALDPPLDVVLSPIGRQGFVLGRGNLPVSAAVVRRAGVERVRVVATPTKLLETPRLAVDTGDPALDAEFPPFLRVVTGWSTTKLVRLGVASAEEART